MATSTRLIRYNPETIQAYPTEFNFHDVPLSALRLKARSMLSSKLNPPKILFTEEGLARDWRGVMHCANLHHAEANLIHSHHDHMASVLKLWSQAQNGHKQPNFAQLLAALEMIDRFDVADDIKESLEEDAIFYITNKHMSALKNISESTEPPRTAKIDEDILTTDDVERSSQNLPPQFYDAFVLFADEDIDFATELIERMEDCGLKLCVKERDLIGGVSFEHEAILRLISERCNRLVALYSPAFLRSPYHTFFVNFAQALGIDKGKRKLIPCLYQKCEIPATLSYCFILNYERSGKLFNFWEKLRGTLRDTPDQIQTQQPLALPSIKITEVDSTYDSCAMASIQNDTTKINISPLAKPRRLRNNLLNTKSIHDIYSSDENHNAQMEYTNDLLDSPNIRIMPPQPPMRSSASMVNLPITSPNGNCLANSSPSIGGSTTSVQSTKKRSWYEKLLSLNASSNGDLNTIKTKKTKQKWYRRKLATYS